MRTYYGATVKNYNFETTRYVANNYVECFDIKNPNWRKKEKSYSVLQFILANLFG